MRKALHLNTLIRYSVIVYYKISHGKLSTVFFIFLKFCIFCLIIICKFVFTKKAFSAIINIVKIIVGEIDL